MKVASQLHQPRPLCHALPVQLPQAQPPHRQQPMSKVVKTLPLQKLDITYETTSYDSKHTMSLNILHELVRKIGHDIDTSKELGMLENFERINNFIGKNESVHENKPLSVDAKEREDSVSAYCTDNPEEWEVQSGVEHWVVEKAVRTRRRRRSRNTTSHTCGAPEALKICTHHQPQHLLSKKQIIFKNYPLFHLDKQVKMRLDMKELPEPTKDRTSALSPKLYRDYRVNSIFWNPVNPELYALGLAKNTPSKNDRKDNINYELETIKDEGAVLIYSLKNHKLPENIIKLESSVMTIDFSEKKPYIFAIGQRDSAVEIFDFRKLNEKIGSSRNILTRENSDMASKHTTRLLR